MYEFYTIHKNLPSHVFIASFVSFIILNFIENLIHFNAGKFHDSEQFIHFEMPSKKDMLKIIIIMIIFAGLQATFTLLLYRVKL